MNRLIATIAGGTLLTGLVVGGVMANTGQASAPIQDPAVAQKLSEHDQELANHEARITNTENNVNDLQVNTNTPSSSRNVSVPQAPQTNTEVTQPSQPTPAVTVSSYTLDPVEPNGNQTCHLVYSDGTKFSFLHKQSIDGGMMVTNGACDDSVLGKVKADNYVGYAN